MYASEYGLFFICLHKHPHTHTHTHSHSHSHTHNQETIANLSSKVETLKSELAALRRSLALTETDGAGESVIMFTRLDSERNTRTLKAALEKERLALDVCSLSLDVWWILDVHVACQRELIY